jgi:hypothetical protein
MNNTLTIQKKLAHFINFNSHPHASYYNTIDGILHAENVLEDIKKVMGLLQKEFVVINYFQDISIDLFLKNLAQSLVFGKTVFIVTHTLRFDPIVYDKLMEIRLENRLPYSLQDGKKENIAPRAKIFIVFENKDEINIKNFYDLTDHVLNLKEEI